MHAQKHIYLYLLWGTQNHSRQNKISQMLILHPCFAYSLFAPIIISNDSCHVWTVLVLRDYILINHVLAYKYIFLMLFGPVVNFNPWTVNVPLLVLSAKPWTLFNSRLGLYSASLLIKACHLSVNLDPSAGRNVH